MKQLFAAGLLALSLAGCQTDPVCRQHTAATFGPNQEAWRAMSPAQRQEASRSFNDAARRCGWEP
jgi:hypothetical protein